LSLKESPQPVPIHVLMVGLYPLLFLWYVNIDQIPGYAVSRALAFSILLIVVSLAVSLLVFRNLQKAAVFTSAFLLLFYLYGHLFPLLDMKTLFGLVIGRHRYLLLVVLILLILLGAILQVKKPSFRLTYILNISSTFLAGMVVVQIAAAYVTSPALASMAFKGIGGHVKASSAQAVEGGRDVYYIILDAYGRQDLLKKDHDLDNSVFIQGLRDLGFSVQDCAMANYARTPTSLASSLNFNYLDQLGIPLNPEEERVRYDQITGILQNSQARQVFEGMGYQFVTFKGVYTWLNIEDSDLYINNEDAVSLFDRQETINFHYLYLRTSALRFLFEMQEKSPGQFEKLPAGLLRLVFPDASLFSTREYRQYKMNLYALERLGELPKMQGKKFVYAHLFITHQPYVFNPDGSFRWPPKDSPEAYADQVRYVDSRMIDILKKIITESKIPPVIVIQGDHGYPNGVDRMKILNAYYLPENRDRQLYPKITPVNTFRIILSQYFEMNYPLLEDRSYYSEGNRPYRFEEVPIQCP